MLFSLLLAITSTLLCFFLFLVIFSNFLIIPDVKETIKVKLALGIPTEVPITVVKEIIDTPSLVAEKNNQSFIYVIKCSNIFT